MMGGEYCGPDGYITEGGGICPGCPTKPTPGCDDKYGLEDGASVYAVAWAACANGSTGAGSRPHWAQAGVANTFTIATSISANAIANLPGGTFAAGHFARVGRPKAMRILRSSVRGGLMPRRYDQTTNDFFGISPLPPAEKALLAERSPNSAQSTRPKHHAATTRITHSP